MVNFNAKEGAALMIKRLDASIFIYDWLQGHDEIYEGVLVE